MSVNFSPVVLGLAGATVVGLAGQQILLPLFIATERGDADPYFVLFFCSLIFNFVFWPLTFISYYQGAITPAMLSYKGMWKVFGTGFFNALNGFMVVFSSPADRVSPPLQAILVNTSIPFTILISKLILGKTYENKQLYGAICVFIGICFALIPVFMDVINGEATFGGTGLSSIPAVMTFIFEEWVFEDFPTFDIRLLLAVQSLVQFFTVGFFFFIDLVPSFGFARSTEEFWIFFQGGFACFLHGFWVDDDSETDRLDPKCDLAAILGIGFAVAYCCAYGFGGLLCKYASANFTCITNAITPCLVVAFWFTFPGLSHWADGPAYTTRDIIFNSGALPFIAFGILYYRYHEPAKRRSSTLQYQEEEQEVLLHLQEADSTRSSWNSNHSRHVL